MSGSGPPNVFKQSYFISSIDVLGPTNLRNNANIDGDVSIGGQLYLPTGGNIYVGGALFTGGLESGAFANDISFGSRLFVGGDLSMGGRLFLPAGGNIYVGGNLFGLNISELGSATSQAGNTFSSINTLKFDTDAGFSLTSSEPGSVLVGMNSTFKYLDVSGQATGNLVANGLDRLIYNPGNNIAISTSIPNSGSNAGIKTLNISSTNDVSYVNLYTMGKTVNDGDVSMNARLFVGKDVIISGRLNVYEYTNNNIIYTNVTTSNYTLIVAEDMTLNGRLNVNYDVSLNARLFVGSDASFGGNLYVARDLSMNGRLFLPAGGNIYVGGVLFSGGGTSTNFANDVSFGSRLFVGGDLSMGGRLFVGSDASMSGNLYVAKNLGIGINSTTFALDVSGTTNFRSTVNPFTLIDGSVLLTNTPPLDFSSNMLTSITPVLSDANRNWGKMAMSANGQYQIACVSFTGNVYLSNNYGVSWRQSSVATSKSWTSVSISANGQYIAASGGYNGYLYLSSNYGNTWSNATAGSSQVGWNSVSMSATGQYLLASPDPGATSTVLYSSSNYGNTWFVANNTSYSNPMGANWGYTVISSTGQYQVATIRGSFAYPYVSSNYGLSFTQYTSTTFPQAIGCSGICMSATGQYILILGNAILYLSTNYGNTFITANGGTAIGGTDVTMSANGQYQIAVQGTTTVYLSNNYGATFSAITLPVAINSIAMSGNGQYITGAVSGGYLYSSITPYVNLAVSNRAIIGGDVSMNSRLFVGSDASFGGNLFVSRDVSMNSRLFVGSDVSMNGNLYVAKNLGIGINSTAFGPSGQIFALDVSGTTNFRGPVNPITLSDNSVLLTNTPALDFNNFGTNWVDANTISYSNYISIKMSANGQYVFASYSVSQFSPSYPFSYAGSNYYVATSNNFGNTWNIISGYVGSYYLPASAYVSISANGQYQSYCINQFSNTIYYSSNYGGSFSSSTNTLSSSLVAINMNASGQYQTSIANGGYIYYSTNYGVNWTQSSSSTGNWSSIAINASGQYQTATANVGIIYYSTNYGVNWTQSSSLSGAWKSLAMSASGQYQSAAITNSYIYYSTNYGVNWTQTSSSTAAWTSVTMSANGQLQIAAGYSNILYVSKDYGITWSSITVSTGTVSNIAMSANGQYLVGTNSNTLRLSTTPYFNVAISGSTLASTSTSTGALTVGGGVGVGGNLYVGGTINAPGQPQSWYITGSGANGTTATNGATIGASTNTGGGGYFSSTTVYGGASASAFNNSAATFTAPSNGLYFIQLNLFCNSTNVAGRTLQFITTSNVGSQYCTFNNSSPTTTSESSYQWVTMAYFTTGQTFKFTTATFASNSITFYYAAEHTMLKVTKVY